MKTFRFTTIADRELMDAAIYLEIRSQNLGRRFLNRVTRTIELLMQFPGAGARVEGTPHRKHNVRGFSYKLIYCVKNSCLWIVAVAHHRRDPDDWQHRGLPEESD